MTLPDAYRLLEVTTGATEDAVRDARKTLSKVWHPDRYTNDPELQAKAEAKLREINEAFELVRSAGFPAALPAEPAPKRLAPTPTPVPPAAPAEPPPASSIDFVPRRRVRWPVLFGVFAAIGVGAYFAILKLGAGGAKTVAVADAPRPDPLPVAAPDADAPRVPDRPPRAGTTYTVGATKAEVIALQGEPNATDSSSSSESTTMNGRSVVSEISNTKLTYGHSEVDLVDDRVAGWWDNDVRLKVGITPHDPAVVAAARARGTLAKGHTTDDVLGVLGIPTRLTTARWGYGSSGIDLDDAGRIVGWTQGDVDLHVAP